jgi:hypothetical protein
LKNVDSSKILPIRRSERLCRWIGLAAGHPQSFFRTVNFVTTFMKPVLTIFLGLASLSYAQTTVTLDGASGSQTFNVARSTTGGLSLGLGFEVEYLLIGGGGAGGATSITADGVDGTGGGGAGGFVEGASLLTNQSYAVSVGAGGSGLDRGIVRGQNGGSTTFSTFTALGGGGGGGYRLTGNTGGSGGGGGGRLNTAGGTGTLNQGFAGGGSQSTDTLGQAAGGGGGGAGAAGQSGDNLENGGDGGIGKISSITGQSFYYAGGGGGAGIASNGDTQGLGGLGGGGNASRTGNGGAGANGFGGGGGGVGNDGAGGAGGSGIVIVRYKGASAGTGGTVTTGTEAAAGYTLHKFTNTGASALDLSGLNLSTRLGAVENGVISGAGDLTFTGPGTLTLNATNTYSGITRVNAGTLALGSGGSIGTSSGVSLANGSRFNVSTAPGGFILGGLQTLSGGGTITGDVMIAGTHTPGFSPGIQTFENNLTYSAASSIVWELIDDTLAGRGTSYDGINVGGNLNFSGTTTLSLEFALAGSGVNWSDSLWNSNITGNTGWKIFDVTGTISGFENLKLANSNFMDGSSQTLVSARPNASFSLFQGTDGVYLNYSAVPEPSAALLGGLGVLALLRRRR